MAEAYVTPAGVLIPKEIFEAGPEDRIIVRKVYDYIVVRKVSHPVERFAEAMGIAASSMTGPSPVADSSSMASPLAIRTVAVGIVVVPILTCR